MPFLLWALESLPYNFSYPNTTEASKLKHESYDKLDFYIKGKGYIKHYGEIYSQNFKHNTKLKDDYTKPIEALFAKELGFDVAIFKRGYATYTKEDATYYLKLETYAHSYRYKLLHVSDYPHIITLPTTQEYRFKKRKFDIPKHSLIPDVKGFAISRAKYFDYDEQKIYYDRKPHLLKGNLWQLEFYKIVKNSNSYRYILAHDYKQKLLDMGAKILKDSDSDFVFSYEGAVGVFSSYKSSMTLKIIQQEQFKQSLILTPDSIKAELDKTGKVTLKGIYFDFDKATLKSKSKKAILSAVALMQGYSDLKLGIHGYTDSKGDNNYNLKLSLNRAKAVYEAMTQEGISPDRLLFKGHGEEEPIASNDTDEGRAKNRRVELHKISGGDKKSIITIDFIKPIENSIISYKKTYQDETFNIAYTPPYSEKKSQKELRGVHKVIEYKIMKGDKIDKSFSRKAIIKNYENILELYNAKIIGKYSDTLFFKIKDRGDGKSVYGKIDGYSGTYSIHFLIQK